MIPVYKAKGIILQQSNVEWMLSVIRLEISFRCGSRKYRKLPCIIEKRMISMNTLTGKKKRKWNLTLLPLLTYTPHHAQHTIPKKGETDFSK